MYFSIYVCGRELISPNSATSTILELEKGAPGDQHTLSNADLNSVFSITNEDTADCKALTFQILNSDNTPFTDTYASINSA